MSLSAALVSFIAQERTVPVRVVEVRTDTGFDWGDAAIGAAAVLALVAIAYGATVARRGGLGCVAALAALVLASTTYLALP
jgi:uncharacterized protein YwlG (UPF0340 family)